MALGYDLEDDDETGLEPWALGDPDLDEWEDDDTGDSEDGPTGADRWLDEQLGRLGSPSSVPNEACQCADPDDGKALGVGPAQKAADEEGVVSDGTVLRRPAPTRAPRRRRTAHADAAGDLAVVAVPGYVRDRRGTWRYPTTGRAVPGARDLTLRWP